MDHVIIWTIKNLALISKMMRDKVKIERTKDKREEENWDVTFIKL
jgi:hypothetical protein